MKLRDLKERCGECEVICWCGQEPFSDVSLCTNPMINQLTQRQYIDIASKILEEMVLTDCNEDEEYYDNLNKLIEQEVIKKIWRVINDERNKI